MSLERVLAPASTEAPESTPQPASGPEPALHTTTTDATSNLDIPLTEQEVKEEPPPVTTKLYVSCTAEIRDDCNHFMLGLDKCYTTLEKANARVELLGRCNHNIRSRERKVVKIDEQTGCMNVLLIKPYSHGPRFFAFATELTMLGEVFDEDQGNVSPGKFVKEPVGLFFADTERDVANQVWVVAVSDPKQATSRFATSRQSVSTRTNSMASNLALAAPESDYADYKTNWIIDSVHKSSDEAFARAKVAWNRHFVGSRCCKMREHWGFARYAFRPTYQNFRTASYHTSMHVRVERLRVIPEDELLSEHVCAGLADARNKPWRPLCSLPPRQMADHMFAKQVEEEMKLLKTELEEILGERLGYDDLPRKLRLQFENNMRAAGASDTTRYAKGKSVTFRHIDLDASLYHALLHHENKNISVVQDKPQKQPKNFLKKLTRKRRLSAKDMMEAFPAPPTRHSMLSLGDPFTAVLSEDEATATEAEDEADGEPVMNHGTKSTTNDKALPAVPGSTCELHLSPYSQSVLFQDRGEARDRMTAAEGPAIEDEKKSFASTTDNSTTEILPSFGGVAALY